MDPRVDDMGIRHNNRALAASELLRLQSPVLLCAKRGDFIKALSDAGFQTVSLNLPLAKAIIHSQELDIMPNITEIVISLMPDSSPIYLADYEILFDPRYKLDVMKLFCEMSRYNELIVQWCGSVEKEMLIYAEPGYEDYARYAIGDYDINCVV